MKLIFSTLTLAIIAIISRVNSQCVQSYTVQEGDSLFSISQKYGVSLTAIAQANPQGLGYIYAGQVICVPLPEKCPSGSVSRQVQVGETCAVLTQNLSETQKALFYTINPNINCALLQVNQVLCVPNGGSTFVNTSTSSPSPSGASCTNYYIKSGDTCWKLTQNLSEEQKVYFYKMNVGLNCNNLQIGQVVCMPPVSVPSQPNQLVCTSYTVRSGDTCWAMTKHLSQEQLANFYKLNPGIVCNNLQIGQVVCIPTSGSSLSVCNNYSIRSGDTCWKLTQNLSEAQRAEFYKLNAGIDCNNLQINQVVCIPNGTGAYSECSRAYRVIAGDYCYAIEQRLGISIDKCNPGACDRYLEIGQVLYY